MDGLKKKILLDTVVTPASVITGVGGMSLLLLSEMLGGFAAALGFVGLLVAFGVVASNFIFNLGTISRKAMVELRQKQRRERNEILDELDARLLRDRDPRDQGALRNLRSIYDSFVDDLEAGKLCPSIPASMLETIDKLFDGCTQHLEKQYEIWEMSGKTNGPIRERLLAQREELIKEIESVVLALGNAVSEVRALKFNSRKGELREVQSRLDAQLQSAKVADEFVRSLDAKDMSKFSEYQ